MTDATALDRRASEVVAFWRDVGRARWFAHDEALDQLCRERYGALHEAAARGDVSAWESDPEGVMALLILLDQMPRNMFRGSARAWATDPLAQRIAADAIAKGFDRAIDDREMRQFFYLPFMHAEDRALQDRSLALYEAHGDPENLRFARHHHDIVARFGRFPHRNAALGRDSTPEEVAFLPEDGFRG
jgi:uncharacterized protein (DUF924 family)